MHGITKVVCLHNYLQRYRMKPIDICYDKAIKIDPNPADAWNNKGNALDKLKRYDESLICYDKAIEINPNYVDAWNNKGNALNSLKKI